MIPRALSVAIVAPVLAGAALLFSAGAAFAHENFTANLNGSNEVPAGDAALTGVATVEIEDVTGEVCAKVTSNVEGAVGYAHPQGCCGGQRRGRRDP